jgi:hypothetical protein
MGLTDKVTGKIKQAAGDLTDDASLRREGRKDAPRTAPTTRLKRLRTSNAGLDVR